MVTYSGGVAVIDTAGVVIWERVLAGPPSSPVIDGAGNIYIQSTGGLVSYDPGGALRWFADSLAGGSAAFGVGAPTLLVGDALLAPCRREICSVNARDGTLNWRSSFGGGPTPAVASTSPAVGADGTVYLVRDVGTGVPSELVALWGRVPPLTQGWPTEGGGMGRLRRQ